MIWYIDDIIVYTEKQNFNEHHKQMRRPTPGNNTEERSLNYGLQSGIKLY